jgi:hypothetical protein
MSAPRCREPRGRGAVRDVLAELRRLILAVSLPLILVNLTSGCGAMLNEVAPAFPVHVTPPDARIYVDGLYVGKGLTYIRLAAANPHAVQVAANGYEPQTIQIESRASGGFIVMDCLLLLLLIVPGIIALAVDGGSGSWRVLEIQQLSVELQPIATAKPARPAPPGPASVPAPPPESSPPAAAPPGGCQHDAQCKGNRICVAGSCVEPGERSAPAQ